MLDLYIFTSSAAEDIWKEAWCLQGWFYKNILKYFPSRMAKGEEIEVLYNRPKRSTCLEFIGYGSISDRRF